MFGLGTPELLIILLIVIFIFGGKHLPKLGSSLGKSMRAFKQGVNDVETKKNEIAEEIPGLAEAEMLKNKVDSLKNLGKVRKTGK